MLPLRSRALALFFSVRRANARPTTAPTPTGVQRQQRENQQRQAAYDASRRSRALTKQGGRGRGGRGRGGDGRGVHEGGGGPGGVHEGGRGQGSCGKGPLARELPGGPLQTYVATVVATDHTTPASFMEFCTILPFPEFVGTDRAVYARRAIAAL